jgi:hypothetical protein
VIPRLPANPPALWPRSRFTSPLHSEAIAARVGRVLGIAFGICFVTGLLSHYQYHPWAWLPIRAAPLWGYRVTQGVHVITGIVSIPLLLLKIWTVSPRLWEWPPARGIVHGLERGSIAVLVSSALIQVGTGFINILNWYPWPWDFVQVHYWLSYVLIGSLLLHIAVKLPVIRRALAQPANSPLALETIGSPDSPDSLEPATHSPGSISRRGLLVAAGAGAGVVGLATIGQTVTPLQPLGLLAPRLPSHGAQGVPVNKTADQAKITDELVGAAYRFTARGPKPFTLTLEELEALTASDAHLPIACVEGWSIGASWRGPRLLDLVTRAGGDENSRVRVVSLQQGGSYAESYIIAPQLHEALLATHLNGDRLDRDHGYPLRLIAPNRAGVLQTKWITSMEIEE